jgi:hypothetical protein
MKDDHPITTRTLQLAEQLVSLTDASESIRRLFDELEFGAKIEELSEEEQRIIHKAVYISREMKMKNNLDKTKE